MLVCVIPLAPGPSIAKQTKVLEENVIGKYTNLFGASNPHCLRANYKIITTASCFGISINHKAVIRSYCYFFCYG